MQLGFKSLIQLMQFQTPAVRVFFREMEYHVPVVSMIKQMMKQMENTAPEQAQELVSSIRIGLDLIHNFTLQNSNKSALVERSSYLSLVVEICSPSTDAPSNALEESVAKTLVTLGQLCGSGFKFCKDLLDFDNSEIPNLVLNLLSSSSNDSVLKEGF